MWAEEMYSDWATWISSLFPRGIASYKNNTLRIAYRIEEMKKKNIVSDLS